MSNHLKPLEEELRETPSDYRLPACGCVVHRPGIGARTHRDAEEIKETGAITLGHRDSSISFSYLDDKQKPIGFAMDIC